MAPAKYQKPPQAPPTFTHSKDAIISDAKALCDESKSIIDRIVEQVNEKNATFENTVLPLAYSENEQSLKDRVLGFYGHVSANKELRDASTEAEQIMDKFSIEMGTREDVYKLVEAAYRKKDSLDPESQRLLEKERRNFIRNGLNLPPGKDRERFKEIKQRLAEISTQFSKNLGEENGGNWFTIEQLTGVPKDTMDGYEKGTGENEGKLRVTFKYPDLFPLMKYCQDADVRMKHYVDSENRNPNNVALFMEAIVLRDEAAKILGYPNHAAFRIEDKIMKTPNAVTDFLGDLKKKLTPGGKTEVEHLKVLKKADCEARGIEYDGKYFLWDHRFYDRLMVENEKAIDEGKIAEYFEVQSTIQGMFKIFEQIFGLAFVEVTEEDRVKLSPTGNGEDLVWHKDVKIFTVWDDDSMGNQFVGYLYLDLHPREGKYGHAANFNIQGGFLYPNGTRRYPATALVCNFSKPTATKPSLLKHDEVVTLFHELGHGIHDLVSRTKYVKFAGTSVVRDFVEAPSQMLENWCWTPAQIKELSSHWQTDEKIPDDLVEKLVNTRHVNDALFNLRQLHFGMFDIAVHTPKTHQDAENFKMAELYNDMRAEISGLQGPEALGAQSNWANGQATFGHLIGGYDAGYYGYLSSQVYSADMFYTFFKENPMDPEQGRRYRKMILEKGGSEDENEILKAFLGRPPKGDAFYQELGIKK